MFRLNERIISAAGSALFGLFIMYIYISKHLVPLTEIYLGDDRSTHVKVIFFAGIIGLISIMLAMKLRKLNWLKFVCFGFSAFLMIVLPVMICIRQAESFRGFEWAMETLVIGLAPLLFIYAAFLILKNFKVFSLFVSLFFAFFSIYHFLLLIKVLPGTGKAFSNTSGSDLLIMVIFIFTGAFIAFFSLKNFRSLAK